MHAGPYKIIFLGSGSRFVEKPYSFSKISLCVFVITDNFLIKMENISQIAGGQYGFHPSFM
jgi:hypothetical protein